MENLPIELQVEILKRLTPSDRIVCKLVCKTWLDILMKFPEFSVDRKLAFCDCFLHPNHEPVSVFLKSNRKYESLKIGSKTILHPSIKRYWKAIGADNFKTLTLKLECLGYEERVYRVVKMLNSMPNLETLILRKFTNDTGIKKFNNETFLRVLPHVQLCKVTHVIIECEFKETGDGELFYDDTEDEYFETLRRIIRFCPNLKTLTLQLPVKKYMMVDSCKQLHDIHLQYPTLMLNVEFLTDTETIFRNYIYLERYLAFNYNTDTFGFMQKYYNKERKMFKRFHQNCTKCWIDLSEDSSTSKCKKALKKMKNLVDLFITFDGCSGFHKPIHLPSVQTLRVNCQDDRFCLRCIQNLFKSVPNVKWLITELQNPTVIALQNKHLTKLKKIQSYLPTNLNNQTLMQADLRKLTVESSINSENKELLFKIIDSRLTKLSLYLDLTKEEMADFVQKLFEHFPNLNYLHLQDAELFEIDMIIPNLNLTPKFRALYVEGCRFQRKDAFKVKKAFNENQNLFMLRNCYYKWITRPKVKYWKDEKRAERDLPFYFNCK